MTCVFSVCCSSKPVDERPIHGQDEKPEIEKPSEEGDLLLSWAFEGDRLFTAADAVEIAVTLTDTKGVKTVAKEDVTCSLTVKENFLSRYNDEYRFATTQLMPSSAYSLSEAVIEKGSSSAKFTVTLSEKAFADIYALPLQIQCEGQGVKASSDVLYIATPCIRTSGGKTTVYFSDEGKMEMYYNSGAKSSAVVFFPGGAYRNHTSSECTQAINAFNGKNSALGVVYYTLPAEGQKYETTFRDGRDAVVTMRERASSWGAYSKIGSMGCSAGGHMAASMAIQVPGLLDFQIPLFPVISMFEPCASSNGSLLGADASDALKTKYSCDLNVTKNTPPCLIAYSEDDGTLNNSLHGAKYIAALKAKGVKTVVNVHKTGGHSVAAWSDFPDFVISFINGI